MAGSMFGGLSRVSLRWRGLMFVIVPVALVAVVVILFAYRQQREVVHRAAFERAHSILDSIARDAEQIIRFGDHAISVQLADRLRAFSSVGEVIIYDEHQRGHYAYRRDEFRARQVSSFDGEQKYINGDWLLLVKELHNQYGRFGFARIKMRVNRLRHARATATQYALWILGGLVLIGLAIAFFVQRFIVRPVITLARFVENVIDTDGYNDRLQLGDRAEIGTLQTGIHDLLRHISCERERIWTLNEELSRSTERAQRANLAKSRFLARMSHELRTPINGIIGTIELLRGGHLSEAERGRYRDIAHLSCQHLLRVVNDTLDLSRIEDGTYALNEQRFALRTCVEKTIRMISVSANEKSIELRWVVDKDVPDAVHGDESRLAQILINLLGNAVKFTDTGGWVSLEMSAGARTAECVHVHCAVTDNGIGMSPEARATIFEPYVQAGDTSVNVANGAGLGLAITAQLVKRMGGEIAVDSNLGHGSVFRFDIRLGIGVAVECASVETEDSRPPVARRILLVDDNEVNLMVTHRLLTVDGHQVTCCQNGAEALSALERDSFELILMDIHMPVMDGYEATREIRRHEQDGDERVCIIALTASPLSDEVSRILDSGMDDYISKPVDLFTLRAVIARFDSLLVRGRRIRYNGP